MSDGQLSVIDPLEMNLLVAKEIPALAGLNVFSYKLTADKWANEIKRGLRDRERDFHETPWHWKNDLAFFRLGYVCWYVDQHLGIRFREDQKDHAPASYIHPNNLFLNGVMDSRRGTCANMALLHVALAWRLRWPVSLACAWSHLICRYDDGKIQHNIEATKNGGSGFHSHPDDYYLHEYRMTRKAITCGSDLRALTPREMLGVFVGIRARYFQDTRQIELAEADFLLARHLFPRNRYWHFAQIMSSVMFGMDLFQPNEGGHPLDIARWLDEVIATAPWETRPPLKPLKEMPDDGPSDEVYTYDLSGKLN
jgi:hypothetical protein